MKTMISNYIVAGTTEISRLLRFMTVFLLSVLAFSLSMYLIYKFTVPLMISIFKTIDLGWPLVLSILSLFKNYLLVALAFLLTLVVIGYLAYEREDRKKIWDGHYNIAFFVTLLTLSAISTIFSSYYVSQGGFGDSFYHFLVLSISLVSIMMTAVALPVITTLTVSDFISYFYKVYLKSKVPYALVAFFFLITGLAIYEPGAFFVALPVALAVGMHSINLAMEFNSHALGNSRKKLLKLRGYEFRLEHEDDDLIPLCLTDVDYSHEITKKNKENGREVYFNINEFKKILSELYKNKGLSKDTFVYMHITSFTTHPILGKNKVSLDMKMDFYDLDNNFIGTSEIRP